MKKILFIITLLLSLTSAKLQAQEISTSPGFLGILCYIDVDLKNDPTSAGGYAKYHIPQPIERFGYYNSPASDPLRCMGPGNPVIENFESKDPILKIWLRDLILPNNGVEYVNIDAPVQKYVDTWQGKVQAFYTIVLRLIN